MARLQVRSLILLNKFITIFIASALVIIVGTKWRLSFVEEIDLESVYQSNKKISYLDRNGVLLNRNFINNWNLDQYMSLSEFSPFLIEAVISAEDKKFYNHKGVDWAAKVRAMIVNLKNFSFKQGGSTISEQVVRIIDKNKQKTVLNRWLQIWQAYALENNYTKSEILEFYLNQVPFAQNRRGFSNAANLYFDRSLETLSREEMLALVVMLRAPSAFDIRKSNMIESRIKKLAEELKLNDLNEEVVKGVSDSRELISVKYLINHLNQSISTERKVVKTTIDGYLQKRTQEVLQREIKKNKKSGLLHGGVLVVNHSNGEVLSYVSNNNNMNEIGINTITTPRQPASTMKPFLYAKYFSDGHLPFETIIDEPYELAFAGGVHELKNYSRNFYGQLTLREALANSLNIPAVKIIQKVGEQKFYHFLESIGLTLGNRSDEYGAGLALGSAEVSLAKMTEAYTCIANRGQCRQLKYILNERSKSLNRGISRESADLVRDILSDEYARQKEFGKHYFSHQVAFKTGTSTDFRDSWAFVFNSKYLIGVWMGNLTSEPMDNITGASAALKVAKTLIESERLKKDAFSFSMSRKLSLMEYCFKKNGKCQKREDYFYENKFKNSKIVKTKPVIKDFKLMPNQSILHLAIDPRIPKKFQQYRFEVKSETKAIRWFVNNKKVENKGKTLIWDLKPGQFNISAQSMMTGEKKHIEVYVH